MTQKQQDEVREGTVKYTCRDGWDSSAHVESKGVWCGKFSEIHVLFVLPDPGALNYCMHTFPETNNSLPWFSTHVYVFGYGI